MADEVLWQARLHPGTPAGSLGAKESAVVHRMLRKVCRGALETVGVDWGDPPRTWLFRHRWKKGGACPRCGTRSPVVTASARFPATHGAPVHVGDPAAIGIADVTKPDYGDAQEFRPGDVSVFWACGVTPQAVALASKPSFMITHSPGHMFITDVPNAALAAF